MYPMYLLSTHCHCTPISLLQASIDRSDIVLLISNRAIASISGSETGMLQVQADFPCLFRLNYIEILFCFTLLLYYTLHCFGIINIANFQWIFMLILILCDFNSIFTSIFCFGIIDIANCQWNLCWCWFERLTFHFLISCLGINR